MLTRRGVSTPTIKAWHFVGDTLRDGSSVPADGVWLKHTGPVVICHAGFHASRDPFDALQYAPGATLCYVEMRGDVQEQNDKLVARKRRIICRMDATDMLWYFARMQALSVIHLYDNPQDVVLDYLMTGDLDIKAAAWASAGGAAWAYAGGAADSARDAFNELVAECFGLDKESEK